MAPERVVLCGGASATGMGRVADPVELDIYGRTPNVHFRLEEVRRALWTDIPLRLRDLLDLATYVYAADQSVPRANGGKVDGDEVGAGWRRSFRFRVPVREVALWNSDTVRGALESTLSFLSEDEYSFEFVPIKREKTFTHFIDFATTPFDGRVEDVQLFSGGLDSLGGAVAEAVTNRRRVLLLNHRSNEKLTRRHAVLLAALRKHAGQSAPDHVAVRVNKDKELTRETTQRTRSFLFAALGVTFARMSGLDRLRFFENGVVSLNLPPSAQVVGARASRTTHPRVLTGFAKLFAALLGRPFAVENPFLWLTKTDVVKGIADAGCGDLVGMSSSCAHTWARTKDQTHCGVCSQCLDRRFAVLAAGQEGNDPATAYAVDLLTGGREAGEDRTMLAAYLDLVQRVEGMDAGGFLNEFGEVARVIGHVGLPAGAAGMQVFDLYRRHARQVTAVLEAAVAANARSFLRREPRTSLLRIACDDRAPDGGEPDAAPTPTAPDVEGNSFVRRGRCWVIRFGGGPESVFPTERGFEYLRILFERPGVRHRADELHAAVCRRAFAGSAKCVPACGDESLESRATADDVMDDIGIVSCRSRLEAIDELRGRLAEGTDPDRLDQMEILDAEKRQITAALQAVQGRGHRKKKLGDIRDRVRNRVGNAIRRALERIEKYDAALHAHLKGAALHLGHTVYYEPNTPTTWHITD